ncbi:hypothetical protein A8709_25210 [Paenibacillus pectinilyticus]|uniref:Pilus assembly protein PilO n=1 Tax=Paenibacillus pectinilyticus TaxID=512399 RepID=A0A1C1A0S6_9BACL|nr:hypothetical protein [Paenibacillus pectinilyticus]OCT14147.1 hypothetical protein A8709_25210 [Paenibacillus pectinilyticus]
MNLLSSVRNQIIVAVILALALVMVYINFVSPLQNEKESKAKLLTQKKQELDALNKRATGGSALGAEEQVSLSKTRSRVPEVPDVEGLIRNVRMLEVITKMPLASYNFEIGKAADLVTPVASSTPQTSPAPASGSATATTATQPAAPSLAIPIKLNTTAKGDYAQIHRFLEELQTTNRLMQVDKLTFAVKSGAPVKLNALKREITVNVSLVSYYAPGLQKFFSAPLPVSYTKPSGKSNPLY